MSEGCHLTRNIIKGSYLITVDPYLVTVDPWKQGRLTRKKKQAKI